METIILQMESNNNKKKHLRRTLETCQNVHLSIEIVSIVCLVVFKAKKILTSLKKYIFSSNGLQAHTHGHKQTHRHRHWHRESFFLRKCEKTTKTVSDYLLIKGVLFYTRKERYFFVFLSLFLSLRFI